MLACLFGVATEWLITEHAIAAPPLRLVTSAQ